MAQIRIQRLTLILMVVAAAFLQSTNFFTVFGVKPNFSLAALVAIAVSGVYFREFLILTLLSAVLLKFKPGFDSSAAVFAVTALAAFAANRYLPWARYFNNAFLVFGSTIALYFLLSPSFLFNSWQTVLAELAYNLILGTLVLIVLHKNNGRFKF